jgi:hypothetical protein
MNIGGFPVSIIRALLLPLILPFAFGLGFFSRAYGYYGLG